MRYLARVFKKNVLSVRATLVDVRTGCDDNPDVLLFLSKNWTNLEKKVFEERLRDILTLYYNRPDVIKLL